MIHTGLIATLQPMKKFFLALGLTLTGLVLAQQTMPFKTITVLRGLENPWGMAWLPNGDMLITERPGRLRLVKDDKLEPNAIRGLPSVLAVGQGGLMDVAVHPKFAQNRLIYWSYSHGTSNANRTRVARGVFDGSSVTDVKMVFEVTQNKSGGQHFGSRLVFLPDNTLLIATGDGGNPPASLDNGFIRLQAQNLTSRLGKISRINDDGSIPKDNPFVGNQNADDVIFSYGHRNIQGMVYDPITKRIWATEHGARGGDEVNLIQAGKNFGWPLASHSNEYFGPPVSQNKSLPGMLDPKLIWTPSIAPSGLTVYNGSKFAAWKGNLFAGALAGTAIHRLEVSASGEITKEQVFEMPMRIRDVRSGTDGFLYVLTDESNGQLLRLTP
jgi:aldose sugar dehydrogenase